MTSNSCDIEFRVRYSETDKMGVVHHSQYASYFEMGRTELLRQNGTSYREMEESGIFLVVSKLEVRFRGPARYDEELRLTTSTVRLTRARIVHEYELHRKGDNVLLTEGTTTLACVDTDGQVTAIPDLFFTKIKASVD